MKIVVDRDKCISASCCVDAAPGTFALDDENIAIVIDPDGDDEEAIFEAAEECPTTAIFLYDAKTGKQLFQRIGATRPLSCVARALPAYAEARCGRSSASSVARGGPTWYRYIRRAGLSSRVRQCQAAFWPVGCNNLTL